MDYERLFEAARIGDIEVLHKSLHNNPLLFIDITLSGSKESLLHVSIKSGQLRFVQEILLHKPELATELTKDGFRPLDIAAAIGNTEIVRELMKFDIDICRLAGKDRRTALHYAAINGSVGVIDELLSECPNCIEDTTVYRETALHLAVKCNQMQAFGALMKWVERLIMHPLINWADCDGNTILHLAASRKQFESVELLLDKQSEYNGIIEVNAKNSKGLTAIDVLDMVIENSTDFQLRKILSRANCIGADQVDNDFPTFSLGNVEKHNKSLPEFQSGSSKNWFRYFKFHPQRDSPSETRNALLVVAALIASVTFQAGLDPPNGLFKNPPSNSTTPTPTPTPTPGLNPPPPAHHPVVTSGLVALFGLLGTHATGYLFIFVNTLGLTASSSIIIFLTGGFPFQRELLMSIYSMIFTYGISIDGVTKRSGVTYTLLAIAFVLPFAARWIPRWVQKAWKWWRGRGGDQSLEANVAVQQTSLGLEA